MLDCASGKRPEPSCGPLSRTSSAGKGITHGLEDAALTLRQLQEDSPIGDVKEKMCRHEPQYSTLLREFGYWPGHEQRHDLKTRCDRSARATHSKRRGGPSAFRIASGPARAVDGHT